MIIVGSGVVIIDVLCVVCDYVFIGFEFVCGILGLIGGVVYMNVGVYGGEVKDCIDYVFCVNE